MKKFVLSSACLISVLVSPLAWADWPTFSYPTLSELQAIGAIDTQGCQPGMGRIKPNTVVPVAYISKNKPEWRWYFQGSSECLPLTEPLKFSTYQIKHVDDPNNHYTLYSIVTADYSGIKAGYQFELITPPQHWYCAQFNNHLISCANDITTN